MSRILLSIVTIILALSLAAVGCGTAGQVTSATAETTTFTTLQPVSSTTLQPVTTTVSSSTATSVTASTVPAPEVSFVAPVGTGDGHIHYVEDAEGTWGPTGFCVLPDKSVAILDCGDESIQAFSHSGEPLYSIDLTGITISPVDIQWWNGAFAVLEFSSQPKSVLLIDPDGRVRKTIDLWPGMTEIGEGGLRIGRNGELELLEPGAGLHVLTDSQGSPLSPAEMQQTRPTFAFQGGPEFELTSQNGGAEQARLVGSLDWLVPVPGGAGGATPIASDDLGNTYFEDARIKYDSAGNYVAADSVVVRLDSTFRQVGYARIDWTGLVIWPPRMVDVTSDGNVYSMTPKADGVHIDTLGFSPTLPELEPSS